MKARRTLSGIISFICGFFILTACDSEIKKINSIASRDSLADISSIDTEILYTDSSVLKMKMITPEYYQYSNVKHPYSEMPKGVEMFFYNKKKKIISSLKSKYAINRKKKKMMEFRDNVRLTNSVGDKLLTERLFVDTEQDSLRSDTVVEVISKDGTITKGSGFVSNMDFTYYEFYNPIGETGGNGLHY